MRPLAYIHFLSRLRGKTPMVKSKFTPQEKARIILESINTRISTAELCRKYNIHPQTFYQWRGKFINGGKMSVIGTAKQSPERVLQKENETLKRIICEQTSHRRF